MADARTIRIRLAAAALGAAALLVPVTIAPGSDTPVTIQEVCADNTCCRELGSTCDAEGESRPDYYEAAACTPHQKQ